MDVETSTPDTEIILSTGDDSGKVDNRAGLQANQASGGGPDGSGTPVTGGWSPPAK